MPNALKVIAELRVKIGAEQDRLRGQAQAAAEVLRASQEGLLSNEGALVVLREVEARLTNPRVDIPPPPLAQ